MKTLGKIATEKMMKKAYLVELVQLLEAFITQSGNWQRMQV